MIRASLFLAALSLPAAALAAPLPPGGVSTLFDDVTYDGVSRTDPAFTGPVIASYSRTVTRSRDGFDPFSGEVITDLWEVDATLSGEAIRLDDTGLLAFTTTPSVDIVSQGGDPGLIGLTRYTLTGFAGFMVDIDLLGDADFAYVPDISRSADGDTITFDYGFGGLNALTFGEGDTYILRTDAPYFRSDAVSETDVAIPTFGVETLNATDILAPSAVPLPPSLALMGGALALLAAVRRRR